MLDTAASTETQHHACAAISAICLAQLPSLDETPTALPDGLALSPADAARCLLDTVRTAKLLQAVERVIRLRLQHASQVEVLYAGCGPLAPLALLLAPMFPAERVRFSLIDIHPASLACARRLFEISGSARSLKHVLCTDAAKVRLPAGMLPDILVVELMQQALSQEPQLAVTANLLPQCQADAVLVPLRITVNACLADVAQEHGPLGGRRRVELGCLLELSGETLPRLQTHIANEPCHLPQMLLQVPRSAPIDSHLMLRTTMETCEGLVLSENESGLTRPRFELAVGVLAPGDEILCRYSLGAQPGFRFRRPH
jgi:hypothetical protein